MAPSRSPRLADSSRSHDCRPSRTLNDQRDPGAQVSVPCNLCDSENVEVLSLKDRNFEYLRTVICKSCGLIWTDPRPTTQQVRQFYSREYRQEYKRIYRPKRKHILRAAQESILRYQVLEGTLKEGDVVLDVGSGAGVFAYILCQMGLVGRGVEPDRSYAEYSAEVLNVDVTNSFFEDFQGDPGSLDAVLLHHVLEHMEDPYGTLLNARDLLKDGGFLVVGVPNAEDRRQAPYNRYHKAHLYTFNPQTLEAIGRRAGFRVHDRIVGPRHGNMIYTFQRESGSEKTVTGVSGNYERIRDMLDCFDTLRYFTTMAPYRTVLTKLLVSAREKAVLRRMGEEKEIIDSVIHSEIRGGRAVSSSGSGKRTATEGNPRIDNVADAA